MLKKGYLASTNFYAPMSHNTDKYGLKLNEVFGLIRQCVDGTIKVDKLLEGPVYHAGIKRLN